MNQLLAEWQELMQCEKPLKPESVLAELEEWDSLSQTALAAYFDRKLHQNISFDALGDCVTVQDILDLVKK